MNWWFDRARFAKLHYVNSELFPGRRRRIAELRIDLLRNARKLLVARWALKTRCLRSRLPTRPVIWKLFALSIGGVSSCSTAHVADAFAVVESNRCVCACRCNGVKHCHVAAKRIVTVLPPLPQRNPAAESSAASRLAG